ALCNMGAVYKMQGKVTDATNCYLQAIKVAPDYAEPYSNLGNILRSLRMHTKARNYYNKAIELNPCFVDAYINRAALYKDTLHYSRAYADYGSVLTMAPSNDDAFCHYVHLQHILGIFTNRSGNLQSLSRIVDKQIQQRKGDQAMPTLPAVPSLHHSMPTLPAVQPVHSMFYPLSGDHIVGIAQMYANHTLSMAKRLSPPSFTFGHLRNTLSPPAQKMRVGYVINGVGSSPVWRLLRHVVPLHKAVHPVVYSLTPVSEEDRQPGTVEIVDLSSKTPLQQAKRIYADKILTLVNLMGWTRGTQENLVFALRPAPVQVSFLGFASTSGASFIDYLITDRVASPPVLGHFYTEQLIYMPHSYFANGYSHDYMSLLEEEGDIETPYLLSPSRSSSKEPSVPKGEGEGERDVTMESVKEEGERERDSGSVVADSEAVPADAQKESIKETL
ncbi:hypothetical protein KIPB_010154, partial [Kipferlia bialata]